MQCHATPLQLLNLLTYLLTPWSRVLLEKLTGLQLVKKFPAFYGTWKFITAFTSARQLSPSWASSIQFIPPHPTSWRSILLLSSHLNLGLPSDLCLSGYPTKTLYMPLPPSELHASPPHSSRFYHPHNSGWGAQIKELLIMKYSPYLCNRKLNENILLITVNYFSLKRSIFNKLNYVLSFVW
jgi:hypothetical protein